MFEAVLSFFDIYIYIDTNDRFTLPCAHAQRGVIIPGCCSTMNAEGAGPFLARSKGRGGVQARRGRLGEALLSSCGPF